MTLQERARDLEKGEIIRSAHQNLYDFLQRAKDQGYIDSEYASIDRFRLPEKLHLKIRIAINELKTGGGEYQTIFKDMFSTEELREMKMGDMYLEFHFQEDPKDIGGEYFAEGGPIAIYYNLDQFFGWLQQQTFGMVWEPLKLWNVTEAVEGNKEARADVLQTISKQKRDYQWKFAGTMLLDIHQGWYSAFEHELQHLLDDYKYFQDFRTSLKTYDREDKETYYNHPTELEAHFRAAAEKLVRLVARDPDLKKMFRKLQQAKKADLSDPGKREQLQDAVSYTARELLSAFHELFSDRFWEYLTDENEKRIKKRMYTFVQHLLESSLE